MGLENVLTTALQNIANLVPVRVVNEYQQGVRFFNGKAGMTLNKGIYVFVPFLGDLQLVDITDGILDLPLFTVDAGKNTYSVSGSLVYAVVDARDYLLKISDSDSPQTLTAIATGILSAGFRENPQLALAEDALSCVCEEINEEFTPYGCEAKTLYLNDVVSAAVNLRLMGDRMKQTRE